MLDLTNDFTEAADGLEPVTFYRRRSDPESPGTPVAHALRRAVKTTEAEASDGQYTAGDVAWHLPVAELPDSPRPGDVLCDNQAQRWTVLEVGRHTLASRWRCKSRNLSIAYGLSDTVTVLRAMVVKGEGGAAQPVWQPWKTGVRARIQPIAAEIGTGRRAGQTAARVRIFVEENLSLDHTHRIQGPDGAIYKILATRDAERIDRLPSIDAEVSR